MMLDRPASDQHESMGPSMYMEDGDNSSLLSIDSMPLGEEDSF